MITLHIFLDLATAVFQAIGFVVLLMAGISSSVYYFSYRPWEVDAHLQKKIELARVAFGQKIVFALEFFIVADVVQTILKPSVEELIQLGLIVIIRTILSFFLSRELYTHHNV
jgi:uncharacterized membrane protein